jgi:hypothetical protein
VSVSGFAARPNSSPPRRSDNAVQKILELGAMSNAWRNINRNGLPLYDLVACHDDEARRPKAARRFAGADYTTRFRAATSR